MSHFTALIRNFNYKINNFSKDYTDLLTLKLHYLKPLYEFLAIRTYFFVLLCSISLAFHKSSFEKKPRDSFKIVQTQNNTKITKQQVEPLIYFFGHGSALGIAECKNGLPIHQVVAQVRDSDDTCQIFAIIFIFRFSFHLLLSLF